jgi:hypothetical protein
MERKNICWPSLPAYKLPEVSFVLRSSYVHSVNSRKRKLIDCRALSLSVASSPVCSQRKLASQRPGTFSRIVQFDTLRNSALIEEPDIAVALCKQIIVLRFTRVCIWQRFICFPSRARNFKNFVLEGGASYWKNSIYWCRSLVEEVAARHAHLVARVSVTWFTIAWPRIHCIPHDEKNGGLEASTANFETICLWFEVLLTVTLSRQH